MVSTAIASLLTWSSWVYTPWLTTILSPSRAITLSSLLRSTSAQALLPGMGLPLLDEGSIWAHVDHREELPYRVTPVILGTLEEDARGEYRGGAGPQLPRVASVRESV